MSALIPRRVCEHDSCPSDPNTVRLRPVELPFQADERSSTTILIGGLTWKHERLIEGLLRGAGYLCQHLPETDRAAHELGREFCATGLCNPVYFTVGNLIRFLQAEERSGVSREAIVQKYVYFTAACGGPCRFGMYESEFRTALQTAGFYGFRVLSFSQDHGIYASTGHTGLEFSVDFGMNAMHAFILGDLLNGIQHRLKPYEVQPGATQRALAKTTDAIAAHFQQGPSFEFGDYVPPFIHLREQSLWYRVPNTLGKLWSHLYGDELRRAIPEAAEELKTVEMDWLHVRPIVKVIGEFWAQMTESDGNFRMLEFPEKEGAEVSIEPISTWLLYLLHERKTHVLYRLRMALHSTSWTAPRKTVRACVSALSKSFGFDLAAKIYVHHFGRLGRLLGVPDQLPASQKTLSTLAAPHFSTFLRGGEGHLEVGKTLYYTREKMCHLVLALKPFGCLPSIQSDAVQASLVERFPKICFLPIETSADGEVHAYSRVQMALAEARSKATAEFAATLGKIQHPLEEIRSFVANNPELRHPLCPIPRHAGVVSTAANFLLYVDHLMSAQFTGDAASHLYNHRRPRSAAARAMHSTQEIEP